MKSDGNDVHVNGHNDDAEGGERCLTKDRVSFPVSAIANEKVPVAASKSPLLVVAVAVVCDEGCRMRSWMEP